MKSYFWFLRPLIWVDLNEKGRASQRETCRKWAKGFKRKLYWKHTIQSTSTMKGQSSDWNRTFGVQMRNWGKVFKVFSQSRVFLSKKTSCQKGRRDWDTWSKWEHRSKWDGSFKTNRGFHRCISFKLHLQISLFFMSKNQK